jgi:hypothetical protein
MGREATDRAVTAHAGVVVAASSRAVPVVALASNREMAVAAAAATGAAEAVDSNRAVVAVASLAVASLAASSHGAAVGRADAHCRRPLSRHAARVAQVDGDPADHGPHA